MDDALASGLSVINMVSLACEEGVGEGSEGLLSSKRAVCRRVWRYRRFLRYVKSAIALGLLSSVSAY